MAADHFCLKWNNYQSNMVSELDSLRCSEDLVDVTLSCEGHRLRAHKVILSACSSYFRSVFRENPCKHPVVILKNVNYEDVEALLSFVYQGVVYISEKKLASFLQTAELLQIRGLTGAAGLNMKEEDSAMTATNKTTTADKANVPPPPQLLTATRKHHKLALSSNTSATSTSTATTTTTIATLKRKSSSNPSSPCTMSTIDKRRKHRPNKITVKENCENSDTNSNQDSSETECNEMPLIKSEIIETDLRDEALYRLNDNSKNSSSKQDNQFYNDVVDMDDTDEEEDEDIDVQRHLPIDSAAIEKTTTIFSNAGVNINTSSTTNMFNIVTGFSTNSSAPVEQISPGPDHQRLAKRPCPLCHKVISNKSNLLKHMRIRHSDEYNPAKCGLCCKVFKNKYSLRAHVNIYHKEVAAAAYHNNHQSQSHQHQQQQHHQQTTTSSYSGNGGYSTFYKSTGPSSDYINLANYGANNMIDGNNDDSNQHNNSNNSNNHNDNSNGDSLFCTASSVINEPFPFSGLRDDDDPYIMACSPIPSVDTSLR